MFESYCAGTEIKSRDERDIYGIDMAKTQHSKTFEKISVADILISMGCEEGCPIAGQAFEGNWDLPDPTG